MFSSMFRQKERKREIAFVLEANYKRRKRKPDEWDRSNRNENKPDYQSPVHPINYSNITQIFI